MASDNIELSSPERSDTAHESWASVPRSAAKYNSDASTPSPGSSKFQREKDDPSPFDKVHITRPYEIAPGYPQLAKIIASDPNFSVVWNPIYLRHRLLLDLAARLNMIGRELRALDKADQEEDPYILQSYRYDTHRAGATNERAALMEKLEVTLKQYDDLLLRENKIRRLEIPSHRSRNSIIQWLQDERPLDPDEEEPFLDPHELVSLAAGRDNTWLEGKIEEVLMKLPLRFAQKLFTEPGMRSLPEETRPVYFSKTRIGIASNTLTVAASLITAMVPTALLFSVKTSHAVTIIITLCAVLIFSAALAACSRTRPQDIFIATAAFCAILVAFLSQGDN